MLANLKHELESHQEVVRQSIVNKCLTIGDKCKLHHKAVQLKVLNKTNPPMFYGFYLSLNINWLCFLLVCISDFVIKTKFCVDMAL